MLKSTPSIFPPDPKLVSQIEDLKEQVAQYEKEAETVVTRQLPRGYGQIEYKANSVVTHDVMDGVVKIFDDPRYSKLKDELIRIGKSLL